MNKIENAIQTIHKLEKQSNNNNLLNKIHPLIKLLLTVIYIILLTSINKYNLEKTVSMLVYLILINMLGDFSIKDAIRRFKIIFIMLFVVGIANPILDRTIITYIGFVPITTGIISMATLILKGFLAIIISFILISTTGIEDICYSLKLLHVPNILITTVMLIYRYIILLLKEVQRIWLSYSLRAPKQNGVNFKAWGSMIGSLLIRSIDKAEIVYESMELRGFNPECYFVNDKKIDKISIIYFILSLMVILILRYVPIFQLVGNIFV